MPKIDLARRKQPTLGSMRDLVVIATTVEHPDDDVSTIVHRPGVFSCHARVIPLKGDTVLDYKTVFGDANAPTHEVTIRTPVDVKIDIRHWVYCEDKFAKTWFRVRTVEDLGNVGRFTVLLCSRETLDDKRNDDTTQEPPPNFPPNDFPIII